MAKIGIVGAGMVGSAVANALALRGSCDEIVLVDKDLEKANAQAIDVAAASFVNHSVKVTSGDFKKLKGAQVVVLAPGMRQQWGRNLKELLENNLEVFREVLPLVLKQAPNAVLIVATQPVDTLTEFVYSVVPREHWSQVIGVGTALETLQLRSAVADRIGVGADHVHGYVIGQEGDAALVVWSDVTVANLPLREYVKSKDLPWNNATQLEINDLVRRSSLRAIDTKGATYYGIGAMITKICEAVLHDSKLLLTVSAHSAKHGVSLSLTRVIGAEGVIETIEMTLSSEEQLKLDALVGALSDENLVA
jgi:L-lactate dehydrogenase